MKDQIRKINGQNSVIYGMGFIGSLIYFVQHALNFGEGALGFLKALVRPAVLVYKLLEHLNM